MGQLFPSDTTLDDIDDQYERRFVDQLVRGTSPEWFIIPNYRFHHENLDRETDVIVVHPRFGVGVIEVKGGTMAIRQGRWINNGDRDEPQEQATRNSFGVRAVLRAAMPAASFKVAWGVALPQSSQVTGELPGRMMRYQLFLSPDTEDLDESLARYFETQNCGTDLSVPELTLILTTLFPDADFVFDPEATHRYTREQLRVVADAQVEALLSLDRHRRVLVQGRAGTGKTYLATRWAMDAMHSASDEPKRVLFTCYNDPLGERLRNSFASGGDDESAASILVGPFLRLARELEGMPDVPFENTGDHEYWVRRLPSFLIEHWPKVTARFDCIVVDEAQDFSPAWLGLLESLLDPEGDNKFFLFTDEAQRLMDRGFTAPAINAGWVHVEMRNNVRNSRAIARIVRRSLGGAAAPSSLPSSGTVTGVVAVSDDEVVLATRRAIGAALVNGCSPRNLLVVTSGSELRDRLRLEGPMVDASAWSEQRAACELSQRAKGLEAMTVIVAVGEKGIDDAELYVAVSRAIESLTVIGPEALLARLGLG